MPGSLFHEVFAKIPECVGHIALSKVFAQILAVECDVDPFDHSELRDQLSSSSSPQELMRWFTRILQSGEMAAFGRSIGGGPLSAIPREHWFADDLTERFLTSQYSRSKPFEPHAPADTWLFLAEDQFSALWSTIQVAVLGSRVPSKQIPKERTSPIRAVDCGDGQLLGLAAVEAMVGLRRSSIYKLIKADRFPAQVKIGGRALWRRTSIEEWIERLGIPTTEDNNEGEDQN